MEAILSGERPNRTYFDDEDAEIVLSDISSAQQTERWSWSEEEPQATPEISELTELLTLARFSIDQLFRLSMLIRRQHPKGRLGGLPNFVPSTESPDITHIYDKFPKVKGSPWLAERLGNAITRRRAYIHYRQLHRASLAGQQDAVDEGVDEDDPTRTIATSYQEVDENQTGPPFEFRKRRNSAVSAVTSFYTAYGEETGYRVPDLPDMKLDGVRLQYGTKFECPYCRTIQEASDRQEWKYVLSLFRYISMNP